MKRWIITSMEQSNIDQIDDNEEKHLIKKDKEKIEVESSYWDNDHKKNEYDNVFSITESEKICQELTKGIDENTKYIIIPGCGSKTNLQRYIVDNYKNIVCIYCTDYSKNAIKQSIEKYSHPKIKYHIEDTSNLSYEKEKFDLVIISNSILSNSDILNRKMIQECHRVLKPKGKLYGFFPSIYCALDIAHLDTRFSHFMTTGMLNLAKNTFYEKTQGTEQIFYTPLRLNQIFLEASFVRKAFEIQFFDNDYFKKESERVYGLPKDSGLYVWEILAILEKNT